jgi:hypothetical protein
VASNLWFISLTSSTLLSVRINFSHNHTSTPRFATRVWYHMEVMRGMDGTYSKGNPPSRLCLATFCHTWTFRITKMRGKDALHSNRGCLRLDAVHATVLCMDAVSIVNGNVCGHFRECWHERFGMFCDFFCRYTNRDSLRLERIVIWLVIIGRDVCMPRHRH